jgi:[acyl-carrier-protein] S-malonyltransferase
VVISGTPEAVQNVVAQIKVKRAIPLNVSGAFHSPLMAEAAAEFQDVLQAVPFAMLYFPCCRMSNPYQLLKQKS